MRTRILLIFGNVMLFLLSFLLIFRLQGITRILIDQYFQISKDLNGWSHAERVANGLAADAPLLVMVLLCIVGLSFLCRTWRRRHDDNEYSWPSLIQLIFGLVLCGSMGLGLLFTASNATTEKVRDKWEIVNHHRWISKKETMKKLKMEDFHISTKVVFVGSVLNFFYFLVGFLISLGMIRSTRAFDPSRKKGRFLSRKS